MFDSNKNSGRRRPGKNVFTTRSGNSIRLHRSLGERVRANREAKARKRAVYLSALPHNRFKRILFRLHPKRVVRYWFSRDGALMAFKLMGIGIVVCFLLLVGVFAYFRKDLPNITSLASTEGSITYYDRTGQTVLWQDYDAVKSVPVSGENISQHLKDATIAIEDQKFYKHGAFDIQGIVRAGLNDIFNPEGGRQGGSTITQQLVKLNQGWTQDRSIPSKIKELILAVELEREYSKEDILAAYLNTAPYGNIQNGAESAARDYFGKSAKELSLAEAAMMAGIPKSPSFYSPYGPIYEPDELIGRQRYILDQMVDQKMISKQEAEEAKAYDVLATIRPVQPKYDGIKAPYFVLAAKQELEEKYGTKTIKRGGWKVTTTLDLRLQELAEQQIAKGMAQVKRQGGDTAAFAAIDAKTAQMVAIVGGPNFNDPVYGQNNYTQQWIPPGSSFKPYDYVTMINETENTGAGSVLYDIQAPLPGTDYKCTNKARPKDGGNCLTDYDFRYPGPVTIRYGLGGSRNVTAVKAMLTVGTNKVVSMAKAMGLKSGYRCFEPGSFFKQETPCYASSAIGDGAYLHLDEHVNALATLSRMGQALPSTYILKIVDSRGKTIDEWKQPKGQQAVRPDAAYIITDILSDPKASYLRPDRKFHNYKGWKFAIKTGTTNDAKDGLMVSYSTQYASAVWVGSNVPKEMSGSMENMTQPIVQGWMQGAHEPLKPSNWVAPSGVKTLPAYVVRGKISSQHEVVPSPATDLYPSWYKQPTRQGNSSQTVDKVSGKLATSCTPDAAKETQGNANDNIFSADIFVGGNRSGASATVSGSDNVHNCADARPQLTLTTPDECSLICSFTVTVTQGTHPISSDKFPGLVELYVSGQKVQQQNISASPSTIGFTYTPTATGPTDIQAKVTDSVLYDASMSATVNMIAGGP